MTPDRLVPACGDYRCALPEHQRPRGPGTTSSGRVRSGAPLERDSRAVTVRHDGGAPNGKAGDRPFYEDRLYGRPPTRMARKWMAHEVMPGYSGRAATGTDRAGTALGVTIVLLIVIAVAASLVAVR